VEIIIGVLTREMDREIDLFTTLKTEGVEQEPYEHPGRVVLLDSSQ